jgi:hypothetical protein
LLLREFSVIILLESEKGGSKIKYMYIRFRMEGEKLIAEYNDFNKCGVIQRITFTDVEYITGSSKVIFMHDAPRTFAESLALSGMGDVQFSVEERAIYFGAINTSFGIGENGKFYFNIDGFNAGEFLCICANGAVAESVKS